MDIDGDSYPDLLSGSWPGEIYLFRGTADHSFAARELLKDKKGEVINKQPESGSPATDQTIGRASVVSVADWDGNGTLDLIVGNVDGDVYWLRNEGTAQAYAFGESQRLTTTNGKPVHVSSRAGPCVADWDGDGKLDLLLGSEDGSVWLHRNLGTRTEPRLALPVQLVGPGTFNQEAKEVRRGGRSKICVVDWSGDGKPDLLVGDLCIQKVDPSRLTAEDKAAQPRRDDEPHGWVWLFLRK